jgi:hypothetical protein
MLGILLCAAPACKTDTEKQGDDTPERESCTLKVSACINECHKADTLKECPRCCRANGDSCDIGGSYSFYSCQNLD